MASVVGSAVALDDNKMPTPSVKRLRTRQISKIFYKASLDPFAEQQGFRPSLIIGVLYFKETLDLAKLKIVLMDRLVKKFARFRSVGHIDTRGDVILQEMHYDAIDMDYHVQSIGKPGWGQAEVDQLLTKQYQETKPLDKPLWQFFVLNSMMDGRSCLIANVDHAIGDGVAMVDVLLSILDDSDGEKRPFNPNLSPKNPLNDPKPHTIVGAMPQHISTPKFDTVSLVDKCVTFLTGAVKGCLGPWLPADTPNCLKLTDWRHPGTEKACAFGERIPLFRVKQLRTYLPGTTVNDILAAVLNMCIRRYFEQRGDPVVGVGPTAASATTGNAGNGGRKGGKGRSKRAKRNREDSERGKRGTINGMVRATFPINMRRKGESAKVTLGNRFSTGAFQFDLHYQSRIALVWEVKRQIDLMKVSPQPMVDFFCVQNVVPLLPASMVYDTVLDTFGRFTMMMSNVQGPPTTAHLAGQPIDDITFVVFSPIGLYVGLLSYNGEVSLTVSADITREKNPHEIAKFLRPEFDALCEEVMAAAAAGDSKGELSPPKYSSDWSGFALVCSVVIAVLAIFIKIGSCLVMYAARVLM